MVGHHNYWLVLLSVIVSITASYVALEAVSRVTEQRQRGTGWSWLVGAAAALGTGIWSMHFIGVLGFELPTHVSYDLPLTLLLRGLRSEHNGREEGGFEAKENDGASADLLHFADRGLETDGGDRDHQAGARDFV